MARIIDMTPRAILFDRENNLRQLTERSHSRLLDAAERTARLHLNLAEDLLEFNRKGMESIYACESFKDGYHAQKEMFSEISGVASRYAVGLTDLAGIAWPRGKAE